MAEFDAATNTTHAHIVYHGVGMVGKTTNLQMLQAQTPQYLWNEIHHNSRMDFIYRQLLMDTGSSIIQGDARFMFHLITTPGCVMYEHVVAKTLHIADGVVFVVDSTKRRLEENIMSVKELARVLQSYGKNIRTFPIVVQFNKRDLIDALPESILSRYVNPLGWPTVASVASEGVGVTKTFQLITSLVINSLLPQEAIPALAQKEEVA